MDGTPHGSTIDQPRLCSRPTCRNFADVTLTYDYDDRMMAIGPLLDVRADGGYDLCDTHAARIRPPEGWTIVQHRPVEHRPVDDRGVR